ncbi:MAG: SPOR domain-containing protein [Tenacibaculum sp.]|nr:SPOR domain-containing protein [Tenacibaculum sp.]
MKLFNYINDLLYRYDCVVVPNFGGFVTNRIGATLTDVNTFYPPCKQVSFNVNLKHNDGLLANYIASSEKISFEQANEKISDLVIKLKEDIKIAPLQVASIGSLFLNDENKIVFEPNKSTNLLTESFGLSEVKVSEINREPIIPVVSVKKSNKKVYSFIKYAATAAILLTLGITGYNYNSNQEDIILSQNKIEKKIQEATFVINTPLPTINLNIKKENVKKEVAKLHIIVGAFEFVENAEKKKKQLQNKGFNAEVLNKNKWGLFQVSLGNFTTRLEANKELIKARKLGYKDAWVFINKK